MGKLVFEMKDPGQITFRDVAPGRSARADLPMLRVRRHLGRRLAFVTVLFLMCLGVRVADPPVMETVRHWGFDLLQHIVPAEPDHADVVIVAIDDRSLASLGQWPWPRDRLAELFDELRGRGAAVVAFDGLFPEPDRASGDVNGARAAAEAGETDRAFAAALAAGPTVLGMAGIDHVLQAGRPPLTTRFGAAGIDPLANLPHYRALVRNIDLLEGAARGVGLLTLSPDRDGVARRIPLAVAVDGQLVPHFVLEVARLYAEGSSLVISGDDNGIETIGVPTRPLRTDPDGAIWIRYPGPGVVAQLSALDVLQGGGGDRDLEGRIVLIGATAAGLGDLHEAPTGGALAGVEVTAAAVTSLLADTHLTRLAGTAGFEVVLAAVLSVAAVILFPLLPGFWRVGIAVIQVAVAVAVSAYCFVGQQILVDFTFPIGAALAATIGLLYLGLRQQEQVAAARAVEIQRYDTFMSRIAENCFDGLLTASQEGVVLTANRSAARAFGAAADDLAGRDLGDLFADLAANGTAPVSAAAALASLDGQAAVRETIAIRKDGSRFNADVAVTSMVHAGSRVYIAVVSDVTEKRLAETRARQSELMLSDAVESLQDGFALWDADDRLARCNSRFGDLQAVLGIPVAPGQPFDEAAVPPLPAPADPDDEMAAAMAQRAEYLRARQAGGSHELSVGDRSWVLVTHKRTSSGGIVSLYTDITELKHREFELIRATRRIEEQATDLARFANELDEARREAVEACRVAEAANSAKSAFLAMMSHELRTPLNAINGFSEMMVQEMLGPIGPRYHEYSQAIHYSGKRLLTMINTILDLTKIESGAFEAEKLDIDIAAEIGATVQMFAQQADALDVRLVAEVAPGLTTFRADAMLFNQIVSNVVSNALKFTPAGGSVTVAARADGDEAIVFDITDTGIGMAERDLEKALSPFGQIDSSLGRRYEGTGLGLPIAKKAAEKLGGTLILDSQVGKGTRVSVRLPIGGSA